MTLYNKILLKPIRIHRRVEKELKNIDAFTRSKIEEAVVSLSKGELLGMPMSRPMPIVAHGVHELRIKSPDGLYRVFYFLKMADKILVFHLFKKKTQKTPKNEIKTAQRRLKEML